MAGQRAGRWAAWKAASSAVRLALLKVATRAETRVGRTADSMVALKAGCWVGKLAALMVVHSVGQKAACSAVHWEKWRAETRAEWTAAASAANLAAPLVAWSAAQTVGQTGDEWVGQMGARLVERWASLMAA